MHEYIREKRIEFCHDRSFIFRLAAKEKWEPETFDMLDKFIVPDKTFIDIGAWVGVLSIYAARIGAKVFSIEPDRVAFTELVDNIKENELDIRTRQIAISNHNGAATLHATAFGNSMSSLEKRKEDGRRLVVETMKFKTLVMLEHIDDVCLVKIDCEGSEGIFIDEEFIETLAALNYPPVLIAFHPGWLHEPDKAIDRFVELLFPIYDFTSSQTKQLCDEQYFRNAMSYPGEYGTYHIRHDYHSDHGFLLTKKSNETRNTNHHVQQAELS